jgi:dCMP deaminase
MDKRISHDEYFLRLAHTVALRSPCIERQVGCVLVDDRNHILSTGYNGPPSKVEHCQYCRRKDSEAGRDLYLCQSVHAEMNALLQCPDVNKIEIAYVTVNPCQICLRLLANTSTKIITFNKIYTPDSLKNLHSLWTMRLQRTYHQVNLNNYIQV